MQILRITFIETPEYLEQGIRHYETNMKPGMLDDALDRADHGRNISPIGLSKIATNLVRPTGRFIRSNIENGWGTNRIRFAMLVSITSRSYAKEYAYIVGHTDNSDYSMLTNRVKFNPGMRLYFNSITRVNVLESEYRGQSIWQPKLTSHDQVLNKSVFGNTDRTKDKVLLRPTDLYRRQGQQTESLGSSRSMGSYYTDVTSLVGAFSGQLTSNNRLNNSPSSYMSRAVGAYVKASTQHAEAGYSRHEADSHEDVIHDAVDRVDENLLDTDPIFDQMKADTNIMRQGYITFGELLDMSPDFDEDRQLGFKPLSRNRRSTDNVSSMREDTMESIAANILAQSLPTVMLFSMYSMVEGMVINTRVRNNEDAVIVPMAHPYMDGFSTASTYDYFVDQVESTIIPDMTQGGKFDILAKIDADIDGDIDIWIRIDGGPEEYFNYPCFADNLMSPVLSDDMRSLSRVSEDILAISEGFFQRRNHTNPTHFRQEPKVDRPLSRDDQPSRSPRTTRRSKLDW